MSSDIISRLLSLLIVLLGVSTVVFFMIHFIPGDPIMVMLGESATPAEIELLRESLDLHLPLWQQWAYSMFDLLQGDLGHSIHNGKAVAGIIAERFPKTFLLAVLSLMVSLAIAIPLGTLSALFFNQWQDRTVMLLALAGLCLPNFWLGPLFVIVFSYQLDLLPATGHDSWSSIILPALTLATGLAALQIRMIRTSLVEVMNEHYILTARSHGLSECRIVLRHALINALLPTVTIIGVQAGALLTGAVVTEQIFDWPGIGQLMIEAIEKRDYPLVQASVLLMSVVYVMINYFTDILYTCIDPRIRLKKR